MSRYQIGQVIGRGGMATVYQGQRRFPYDLTLQVAIKQLHADCIRKPQLIERFKMEAKICLLLSHPNLVKVIDFDISDRGEPFIVMELVDGGSLELVASAGRLPVPMVRLILRSVLDVLAYLHPRGLIHRDITPRNILLSTEGETKLADLGLTKILGTPPSTMGFMGTSAYASPDAYDCMELGPSSDLYSVAAIAYRLITGEPPFGVDFLEVSHRIRTWQLAPLPSDVPDDLRQLIEGALTYPDNRVFQSARQMLDVLDQAGEPTATADELGQLVSQIKREAIADKREATADKREDIAGSQPEPEALAATQDHQPPRVEPTHELIPTEDRITAPIERQQPGAAPASSRRSIITRRLVPAALLCAALLAGIWAVGHRDGSPTRSELSPADVQGHDPAPDDSTSANGDEDTPPRAPQDDTRASEPIASPDHRSITTYRTTRPRAPVTSSTPEPQAIRRSLDAVPEGLGRFALSPGDR